MEIINDDGEISKLEQDNKFQRIRVCFNGMDSSGKKLFLRELLLEIISIILND